jgi:N-acetylmuramoyl-L-alanine amidase
MIVKSSKFNIKCPNTMEAESITLHNTFNDASANNEVQYMINNNNQVSFHYAVDDTEVVQGPPLNRNAWAAGDGSTGPSNRKSVHVEICYSKSGSEKYKKAVALSIKFIAQLLYERGWGIDRVKKHQDWSGKYCPHRILEEGRWQTVLNAIQTELRELKKTKKDVVPVEQKLTVDGTCKVTYKEKEIQGVIIQGVSYAPVRKFAELQGLQVGWDQQTSTVTLK